MIKHGPKPIITSCGCWLWCDSCGGRGVALATDTDKVQECEECKGNPGKVKMCASHAKAGNWEIDEKKRK